MSAPRQTAEDFTRFREYYAESGSPAVRELERRVLGIDYGGNSYTDVDAAARLAALLELGRASVLLDIGTGAGWPGLFLAHHSGCRVVLSDVPAEGLRHARIRAAGDGIRASVAQAAGELLPFAPGSFDALTHSDVLC